MRKIDELREGCIAKAGEREMCFTLLSRDAAAPATIRFWINERMRLNLNQHGDKQILEAYNCAAIMEIERGRYKPRPQSPTPEAQPAGEEVLRWPRYWKGEYNSRFGLAVMVQRTANENSVMIANYMVELNLAEVAADKFIAFMERND